MHVISVLRAGNTAYAAEGQKRRKTAQDLAADVAAKAPAQAALPGAAWSVTHRQPWADKTVESARPTAEQMAWLEQEGFIKDEENQKQEVGRAHGFCVAWHGNQGV